MIGCVMGLHLFKPAFKSFGREIPTTNITGQSLHGVMAAEKQNKGKIKSSEGIVAATEMSQLGAEYDTYS